MKKGLILFPFLSIILMGGSGCDIGSKKLTRKLPLRKQKEIKKIESLELAKAIMWPKPYKFVVKRDPFKPLMWRSLSSEEIINIDVRLDLKLIGVVTLGDTSLALLESPLKIGIFKENERIGNYIVERIEPAKVILRKGDEKIVLKVGGEE